MKRALVTGASAGLGLALAKRLRGEGWHVVGVDRAAAPTELRTDDTLGDPPPTEGEVAGEAGRRGGDERSTSRKPSVGSAAPPPSSLRDATSPSKGGGALSGTYDHQQCDLSDHEQVDRLLASLSNPFDLAILAAGISATGRFEAIPPEAHIRLLAVNAHAPIVMADALLDRGIARGGRFVLIGSLSSDVGYPGAASYAASKDALSIYARSIRWRAKRAGIDVLTVLPGPIRTDHAERHAPPGAKADRRMDPDDLARRILAAKRGTLRPGMGARLGGALGHIAPRLSAKLMRRALFQKLDREVW